MNNNNMSNKNNNNFLYSFMEECRQHMISNGINFYDEILFTDRPVRFSSDSNKHKKDEWYIAHSGIFNSGKAYMTVIYGSWSFGNKSYLYRSWESRDNLSQEEHVLMKQKIEELRVKQQEFFKLKAEEAKIEANSIWSEAEYLQESHKSSYLLAKGISNTFGLKRGIYKSFPALIIPIENIKGELCSLQYIYKNNDGFEKRFHNHGEKTGNFYRINDENLDTANLIYITEGVATGISLRLALGENDRVVVAMDAGNICPVINAIKSKYPKKTIIVASDNDEKGLAVADIAFKQYGCFSCIPTEQGSDWNDVHAAKGIEEVKKQIKESADKITQSSLAFEDKIKRLLGDIDDPTRDFSIHNLPRHLRLYISSIQQTTQAHPLMLMTSILGMMSSYFGKRIYYQGHSRYHPNLWMVSISESGSFKSTALNKGNYIANRHQAQIYDEIEQLKAYSDNELRSQGLTPDALPNLINEHLQRNMILPNKCTAESLLQILGQGRHGTIYVSEFDAWVQNLVKKHNGDFMGMLTDLYDVPSTYINTTKSQGDDILRSPFISIVGVSTLAWLKKSFKTADLEGGFYARFLFFCPKEAKTFPNAHPKNDEIALIDAHNEFENILANADHFIGASARQYRLSPEAYLAYGDDTNQEGFFYDIHRITASYNDNILSPYPNRMGVSLLKIAMLFQILIDPETDEISYAALQSAFHVIVMAIKSTAHLMQGELASNETDKKLERIYKLIVKRFAKDKQGMKKRELLQSKAIDGTTKDYDALLEMLIQQERIICENPNEPMKSNLTYKPNL